MKIHTELRLPNPAKSLSCEWEGAVHSHFSKQAQRVPQQLAVIDAQVSWNYAELDAKSNQLANYLRENGIQSQDIVAIYSHRSAALIWAMLGVLKAGAAFVILDPAYPASRLINCLQIAQPRGWLQLEAAGKLPDELNEFVKNLSCYCTLELSQQAIAADGILSDYSTIEPMLSVEPDDLLYIAFTSGSTGIPKGILGTHRPLSHFIKWHSQTFNFKESDRFSMLSGLAHDPLLRDIFTPLSLGATLCIPSSLDIQTPGKLADWMQAQQVSISHLTPPMGQLLANITPTSNTKNGELTSLRYAFFGGDKLKQQDILRLRTLAPNVICVNFYGATETPQAMGYFVVPNSDIETQNGQPKNLSQSIPVGRGIEDVQLLILNTDQKLVEIGEVGEIYIRTPYLALGYVGDEQLTTEKYITNPYTKIATDRCYRTGDLGRYLPDGNVELLGRADNQVKIRGFRIEVGEIETVLREHPAVRETVVIARENDQGDKRLVAYVVSEQVIPSSELRRKVQDKLPDYMIPSAFVRLDTLPLTPNGKIDRRALPAPEAIRQKVPATFVAPRTELEIKLAKIWGKVLDIQSIGIKDNFFELGGHSLLAIRLLAEIENTLGKNLPMVSFFEAQTIEQLATLLDNQESISWRSLVKIKSGTTNKPPLFCIHAIWGTVFFYQKLAQNLDVNQPLYGLQAQGLDGQQPPCTSITEMAAHYIQEIRTVQPEGPYHLAGYSLGGLIAYEMARQLQEQGQEIAPLAIFDTAAPGYHTHAAKPGASQISQLLSRTFFHVRKLLKLSLKQQLTYFWERIWWHLIEGKLNIFYKMYLRYIKRSFQELRLIMISEANNQARDTYIPQPYQGRLTLFRATQTPVGADSDPQLGWGQLAQGGVESYDIPAKHENMMEEPQIKFVAEQLQYCINQEKVPQDELEFQLTKIWKKVLGIQHIGIKDNFFELGGHSLLAVQMFAEVEQISGCKLPLATLLQAPTIEELADIIRQDGGSAPWSSLVPIQAKGSKPPLFCIHPIGGNVLEYLNLVSYLGSEQPVYGLQALGLDDKQTPHNRVEDMATHYIKEIRTIQPQGPYLLAGFSFGGLVAHEIAYQLHTQGQKVNLLALFDTMSPNFQAKKVSFAKSLFMRLGHLWQLAPTEKLGYLQIIVMWYLNKGGYKELLRRQLPESLQNFKVLDANIEASDNYVAPVYPGSVTLFCCRIQDPKYSHDHSLGWGELVGGVTIYDVPSYHDRILREPHVQVLAEKLKVCLEQAQS